jgi:hypothetical protein
VQLVLDKEVFIVMKKKAKKSAKRSSAKKSSKKKAGSR